MRALKRKQLLIVLMTGGLATAACHIGSRYKKNPAHAEVSDDRIARGQQLAATYCGSCHQAPTPELLDEKSWEHGVLPQMGPRLGVFWYMNQHYPSNAGDPNIGRGFYPSKPLVTDEQWGEILDYYTALAPDSLPPQQRDAALLPDTASFRLERSKMQSSITPPATCFVRYDTSLHQVLTSDVLSHALDVWDSPIKGAGHPMQSAGLTRSGHFLVGGSIVDLAADSGGRVVCNIGPFGPNNAPAGHVDRLPLPVQGIGPGNLLPVLGDSLLRPVNIAVADLNGDGRQDIVVCEFGFIKGELAWLENQGGGHYQKHILRSIAGAIRVVVQDYNRDGLPDIWVLFAQGDEGIMLYTNKGYGQFTGQQILRFPPCYGSTYFELDDFNHDGNPDILYTCGDNGDFSTVLKPYHGIYIFMNDGHGQFNQRYFYPVDGCYRAMAKDMDGDGDLDIAAIAYFADFARQPEEGFVYLENRGQLKFLPHSIPGTECGRWINMDVADVDGDGRPDILLANCSVGPGFIKSATDWKKGPAFLLLRNCSKR